MKATIKSKLTDYVVTRYVAKFINTLTNLVYIFYATYGINHLRRQSNKNVFRVLPYWGLMGVGIASAAFHMNLKYHTQMMDDVAMHLTTTPVLHRVMTVNTSRRTSIILAFLLNAALIGLIIHHALTDELILHSVTFVVSVTIIGVRTMQLITTRTPKDSLVRRQIWGIVRLGAAIFELGFLVWLVDGWICEWLRSWRATIGLPWAFLLELHGWWHICTGVGAYIFIVVIDHLVSGEDVGAIEESFAWPAPWASRSIFAGKGSALGVTPDLKTD
ncbi:ceramidase [Aspergillus vadensis CBS 113365]|uniref:Alkaline ceramidase family protein n=1 Tax=Aspergillus vadensis (strain CBS 113365 / IMI 142717 / IBT 24658) TaxID=1448311 RepID=A0A319BLF0_ASPVC|nr:alkaline ceramidase family protein [Aspergillus vadensis CBS 113365]PYH74106.1 alkaline ceramidase family protein [Aspergillus vadensis CBS 113365]